MKTPLWIFAALSAIVLPGAVAGAQTVVTINAATGQHTINPNIYGVAFGDTTDLEAMNIPLNRYGGDDSSCYNWELNASNKGDDWYFESLADSSNTPGYRGDSFIASSKAAGAQAMITIPTIGWVANQGPNQGRLSSFSIAKYGPQTGNDWQWFPDAGNGISSATNEDITGNNPNDAQTPSSVAMQQGWINHIIGQWGTEANGGLKYYIMDNEPSIWFGTHRDVHPIGPTMDEILNDILTYGAAVKDADPNARVVGPEEWGWDGYFYSGYDQQWAAANGWNVANFPDRKAHGGMDYVPYLLQQIAKSDKASGRRTLDYLSLHYYPQSGEYGNDTSAATDLLRNESTRSLWDPNYVDQSWIDSVVELIPRMKSWVATYYPGTKLAITEYSWGADDDISGATAQADVLGILGSQGVDMATRWTQPALGTPTYKAFQIYRNYDGDKHDFGDTSVSDTVPNPDDLSSFAAIRDYDGALTIVVDNKVLTGTTPITLDVSNFAGNGVASAWQLSSANAIVRLNDRPVVANAVSATLPAQSVTIFVLPKSTVAVTKPLAPVGFQARPGNAFAGLNWTSNGAVTYKVERKAGTGAFAAVATTAATAYTDSGLTNGTAYTYYVEAVNSAGTSPASKQLSVTPLTSYVDKGIYNFETSTQGWTSNMGVISSVETSLGHVYSGTQSLAVNISTSAAGTNDAFVSAPSVPAGAKITFHVWVPSGSGISSIQPYALQNATGNWTWTGAWTPITSLTTNAWNTISITVPSNASPLDSLGVEFSTSGAWTGTCYIDSVNW
jgi:hypothetical protein